ncbi:MAG: histidine phosphatase family protein [Magnetococcus sp. WYHC-3]
MARKLLIMRHAKSAWDTDAPTDFERPLSKRGIKDAPKMGRFIKREKLVVQHVVSSPAERAQQTAREVCRVIDFKRKALHLDPRIYGAALEDLLEVLGEVPARKKTVLLVGHNPGLEYLFSFLVNKPELNDDGSDLIKTATLVQLKMPDDWSDLTPGCAALLAVTHPRDLPD